MNYTSKLRLLIFIIALLPPLIIISILKLSTEHKAESFQLQNITQSIKKADAFVLSEQGRVRYNVQELIKDSLFLKSFNNKNKQKEIPEEFLQKYNLSFLYVVNNFGDLMYTTAKNKNLKNSISDIQKLLHKNNLTKEVDSQGNHAAFTYVAEIDSAHFLYAGKYIDQSTTYLIENISDATVSISFAESPQLHTIDRLIKIENGYQVILLYSADENVVIRLQFPFNESNQFFVETVQIISLTSLAIILLAVLAGLYFTGKTKKELDNLRSAFAEVADGNFDTTVMAYEKSEFSELADSFSEMVTKLKTTQSKLATVEKIAAWETVGRKLAHEIKNPLSPISIAADDLRSSYYEKLPNFEKVIDETTSTIKKEVKRMTMLLDEFVSFARMKHSELHKVEFSSFVQELQKMYVKEITEQKLYIRNNIQSINILMDKDTLTQLFINLIKNGFESIDKATVTVTITKEKNKIKIVISDTGPGFSETKLTNSFMPFDSTKEHGSGLGLVICHRIILDHNGTMTLQNGKNGGGEVVITLPIV